MNFDSIIGTGYVGLVTGTGLSEFGLKVVCIDTARQKINDMGESSAIPIIHVLLKKGSRIRTYCPRAAENANTFSFAGIPGEEGRKFDETVQGAFEPRPYRLSYFADEYGTAKSVDAFAALTERYEFRPLDLTRIVHLMRRNYVIGFRNIYESEEGVKNGFVSDGVGQSTG